MHEFTFFKVARFFLDNPYQEVYLRELAKKLKISPFAVKGYADVLLKEGLILEERKANLRFFKGNAGNPFFRHIKISLNVDLLMKSGLVDFLKENIPNISSIVLFGSLAKGENDSESDVDLLVIGKETRKSSGKFGKRFIKENSISASMTRNASIREKIEYLLNLPEKYKLIEKGMLVLFILTFIWLIFMLMGKG